MIEQEVFFKTLNIETNKSKLYMYISHWNPKAIFSWDMGDFIHGVSSNVRWIGVQIEQKRLCTLYSKCYHGTHNDPRLLKFSTPILLFRQLCNEEILICIFSNRGASSAKFVSVTVFALSEKTLLVC